MKQWKRLAFYLLLNVLVSACTTFAVLSIWDRTQHTAGARLLPGLSLRTLFSSATPTQKVSSDLGTPAPGENVSKAPTPTAVFVAYQVKSGDDFASIAREHGISMEELIRVNGFTKSQPLGEGEVLRIPVHPEINVAIDSVVGAGDLGSERVLIKHFGQGELSLVGWKLEDDNGNVFVFPQFPELTLFENGAVNVYTKSGTDTVVDLYWGLDQSVWSSGETVTLRDNQGEVRATYQVP